MELITKKTTTFEFNLIEVNIILHALHYHKKESQYVGASELSLIFDIENAKCRM